MRGKGCRAFERMNAMKDRKAERVEMLSSECGKADRLIDLSTAGAAFLCSRELKPESKITLKINELMIDAHIVYCHQRANDGYRIGTLFKNVSPEVQKGLEDLVAGFSRGTGVVCKVLGQPPARA